MTRATGLRRHVAIARRLDGTADDAVFGDSAGTAARDRRRDRHDGPENRGKPAIFGLARTPQWAHHSPRDYRSCCERRLQMTKLLFVTVAAAAAVTVTVSG